MFKNNAKKLQREGAFFYFMCLFEKAVLLTNNNIHQNSKSILYE